MTTLEQKILGFLLNNEVDYVDRVQVADDYLGKFPNDRNEPVVKNILDHLKEKRDVPSWDHYIEELDLGVSKPDNMDSPCNKSEIINLINKRHTQIVENEITRQVLRHIEENNETIDSSQIIGQLRYTLDKYDNSGTLNEKKSSAEMYQEDKMRPPGLKTYLEELDDKFGSLQPGSMSTIGAWGGHLKTTHSLNIAWKNMVYDGKNFIFFSLEMARKLIVYKLLSLHTTHDKWDREPISFKRIQEGHLSVDEEQWLFGEVSIDLEENDEYGSFEILSSGDIGQITVSGLRSVLNEFDWKPDLLIVDYAQLLANRSHPFKTYDVDPVNVYIQFFNDLAKNTDGMGHQCHVMMLSQVNRDGYNKACSNGGRYTNDALLSHNGLDQNSSYIIFSFAPEELRDIGQSKVYIGKNRYGEGMVDPAILQNELKYSKIGCSVSEINPNSIELEDIF